MMSEFDVDVIVGIRHVDGWFVQLLPYSHVMSVDQRTTDYSIPHTQSLKDGF